MRVYHSTNVVEYCRKADKEGILSRPEMAMLFDVTTTTIWRWVTGKARDNGCKIGRNDEAIQTVIKSSTDECILWPYAVDKNGYGKTNNGGAHRQVCILVHGPQPADKPFVLHSCDTPRCVNHRHLRWGTAKENAEDRGERTPNWSAKGEQTGHTILKPSDIPIIRNLAKIGWSDGKISRKYKVHRETIRLIRIGRNWKHIP